MKLPVRGYRWLVGVLAALLLGVASAGGGVSPVAKDSNDAVLKSILVARFPDIKIQSVSASSWPGVYEVVTQNEIVYSDATGDRLIVGNMMDAKTHENLTGKRWNELNGIDFNSLPFDQAIRVINGDGSRKLAVFEDPFCSYCRELEQTLQGLNNTTIYVFLYPLEAVHPGASLAARDIWCAADRTEAWHTWMNKRKAPPENDCENAPIVMLTQLGDKLKINSTPTLFFGDGRRVAGAIPLDRIEMLLNRKHP